MPVKLYIKTIQVCYKYIAKEVKCPMNTKEIKMTDLQH